MLGQTRRDHEVQHPRFDSSARGGRTCEGHRDRGGCPAWETAAPSSFHRSYGLEHLTAEGRGLSPRPRPGQPAQTVPAPPCAAAMAMPRPGATRPSQATDRHRAGAGRQPRASRRPVPAQSATVRRQANAGHPPRATRPSQATDRHWAGAGRQPRASRRPARPSACRRARAASTNRWLACRPRRSGLSSVQGESRRRDHPDRRLIETFSGSARSPRGATATSERPSHSAIDRSSVPSSSAVSGGAWSSA
jgi:hypothetical protein